MYKKQYNSETVGRRLLFRETLYDIPCVCKVAFTFKNIFWLIRNTNMHFGYRVWNLEKQSIYGREIFKGTTLRNECQKTIHIPAYIIMNVLIITMLYNWDTWEIPWNHLSMHINCSISQYIAWIYLVIISNQSLLVEADNSLYKVILTTNLHSIEGVPPSVMSLKAIYTVTNFRIVGL